MPLSIKPITQQSNFPIEKKPSLDPKEKNTYSDVFALQNGFRILFTVLDNTFYEIQTYVNGMSGGVPEAPVDGVLYGRKNATWEMVPASIPDAPTDSTLYGRFNGMWLAVPIGIPDAPANGNYYSRRNNVWAIAPTGISDAPSDGTTYGRRNAAWVAVSAGIPDAPNDGNLYGRQSLGWVKATKFTYNVTAPGSPNPGDRWVDANTGIQYTWIDDGTSTQWVQL